jgi:hypothetical protein
MPKNAPTPKIAAFKPRAFFSHLTELGCVFDAQQANAELNGRRARMPTQRKGEFPRDVVRTVYRQLGLLGGEACRL